MTYTEELLSKADEVIPRVTLDDFKNDLKCKGDDRRSTA